MVMARPRQGAMFNGSDRPRVYPEAGASSGFSAKPAGYAAAPGSGPAGETCGSCGHCRQRTVHGRNFYKCALMMAAWSRDRATDIVLRSPACSRHQPGTPHSTTAMPTGGCD